MGGHDVNAMHDMNWCVCLMNLHSPCLAVDKVVVVHVKLGCNLEEEGSEARAADVADEKDVDAPCAYSRSHRVKAPSALIIQNQSQDECGKEGRETGRES